MSKPTTKKRKAAPKPAGPKVDQLAVMTEKIVAAIEAGQGDPQGWKMPWHQVGGMVPRNIDSRKAYRGGNHLYLWVVAAEAGATGVFGTYNQWSARHCQVRKGEKGHMVLRWIELAKRDENGRPKVDAKGRPETFMVPKVFTVFGLWQVDDAEDFPGAKAKALARLGLDADGSRIEVAPMTEVIGEAEAFFEAVGAEILYGQDQAFYAPKSDYIGLPNPEQFRDAIAYAATKGHEHIHWTGHGNRLGREGITKTGGPSSEVYALEELVAEMGAAFLGQRLGYATEARPDHVHYVAHWLDRLKADPKLLWKAAREAEAAVDYLAKLAGLGDELPADDEAAVDPELAEVG